MIVKFGDVAERLNIKVDQSNTDLEVYVGGEHIDGNELLVHRYGPIKGSTIGYQFQFGFEQNDVLFMTKNPHLRKASMAPFRGLCSIATFVIRTKSEEKLLQEYLAIIMQSDDFWNYCEQHKSGGVNYFINWGTLSQFPFELPSIEIQKEISNKVWAAYRLKEAYKKLLASTDEMVKSQFIEMFGNPFDECSGKVPLYSLCIINPLRPRNLDDSLPVSFIPMEKISEEGEYSTFNTRPLGEVKKGFTYCADDDVLFAKITPCIENGKGALLKELSNGIGFGSTEFHVLRPLPGISTSTWLYNLTKLDILRKDAAKNMTGTGGQKRVPASYLENFSVLPPSIDLQDEFAEIVRQADKSKYYVQNKLNYICHILTKQIPLRRCS